MEQVLNYAKSLNAHADILWWLENVGKKNIKLGKCAESDLEHVVDWFCSESAPKRLQKMSLNTAIDESKKWSEMNIKKGKNIKDTDEEIEKITAQLELSRNCLLKLIQLSDGITDDEYDMINKALASIDALEQK